MKYTFGKIGLSLAGAVAAVGLMSAGVQTANAQLELSAPVVTNNATNAGVYDWTYTVTLQPTSSVETLSAGSYFDLSLASDSELVKVNNSYYTSNFLDNSKWAAFNGNTNTSDLYGSAMYNGSGVAAGAGGYIGTVTIYSSTDRATVVGYNYFTQQSGSNSLPDGITVGTTSSTSSGPDFASLTNEKPVSGSVNPSYYSASAYIPSLSGSTVLSPLPLPAAFWPGLMTLGGMAVVGGLRLRRRSV